MQTTLRINDQIFREAKAEAARLGVTLTKYIEEALQARLRAADSQVQAEVDRRDRLMEDLLQATAHFRVGPHPKREEMHGR